MGEFVGERRGDPENLEGLLGNQFGEFLVANNFLDGKRMAAFYAGEVIEVAPDV